MIRNNSYYKGQDLLEENKRIRMNNFFNPFEYNFESNLKDEQNSDFKLPKSKGHNDRKIIKK